MSSLANLEHIWSTITEVDTHAIREQVQTPFRVAVLGSDIDAVHWLIDALRKDPFSQTFMSLPHILWAYQLPADQDIIDSTSSFDLILVVLPLLEDKADLEVSALQELRATNPYMPTVAVHVSDDIAFYVDALVDAGRFATASAQIDRSADDPFESDFINSVLAILPEKHVALAHHLPGLRPAIAKRLIRETSLANAGYAASTGVAELVPVLFLPLNVADLIILSKNQALMSYKLALCLGQDMAVQDMAVELAGILGSGFLWRELARTLVGWVPGWGIVPKIAIAYAGTYVVGEAVFYWYAYRQRLSAEHMRELYAEALVEGREKAATLIPKQRPQLNLPSLPRPSISRPSLRRKSLRCPNCQQKVGRKNTYCPHCGFNLSERSPSVADHVEDEPVTGNESSPVGETLGSETKD